MSHRNEQPGILFYLFALTLIYGIFFMGVPIAQENIADRQRRDIFLLAVGLLGVAAGFAWGKLRGLRRPQDRILVWATVALPCYVLFQIVPLPLFLVGFLSPARAELVRALEPLYGKQLFASLSIAPSYTFAHFLLIASYCIVLLAAREFSRRAGKRIWLLAAPVVLTGMIESALALIQFFAPGDVPARGTFGVRNHLAGFLEMGLPLAAMYGIATLRRSPLYAIAGFAAAALLLAGALCTLSRGGVLSLVASALVMVAYSVGRDMPLKRRLLTAAVVSAAAVLAFIFLVPESLIARFSEHNSAGRTAIWREGLGLIREFPLVGCGVGGFQSAFLKFKAAEGTFLVDYAHNDYLQTLAELGIPGFLLAASIAVLSIARSIRRAAGSADERWVGLACLGAFSAMLVHSAVDFNLYVAANAAVLAWICGIAAGLAPSAPRLIARRVVTEPE